MGVLMFCYSLVVVLVVSILSGINVIRIIVVNDNLVCRPVFFFFYYDLTLHFEILNDAFWNTHCLRYGEIAHCGIHRTRVERYLFCMTLLDGGCLYFSFEGYERFESAFICPVICFHGDRYT